MAKPAIAGSIAQGALIGRYVVLSRLGAGAMGVVLAAYDPELDRKVALKLLKPRGDDPAAARARLQREAQALAKLDHPNVVAVYDVGMHGDQLFVAMEFVKGHELSIWARHERGQGEGRGPRWWRDILRVFGAAGRGLAAAHEAGLVHRDFKPDNVMIGDDGRVRVMDFGLARAVEGEDSATPRELAPTEGLSSTAERQLLTSPLTQTGALMGTPAYMSPEQFANRDVDARSDQFSFAVALYEAFYGQRPFEASSISELITAVSRGELRPPPRGLRAPRWIHKAIVRGLQPDPEDRWPSMAAMLDALERDPTRRRRIMLGVGAGAALLGVVFGAQRVERLAAIEDCEVVGEAADGLWSGQRREQVEAAFMATRLPGAAQGWARVDARMGELAGQWRELAVRNCVEYEVDDQRDFALAELTRECLDERLGPLERVSAALPEATPEALDDLVREVASLRPPAGCAHEEALRRRPRPPADQAVAIDVMRRRVWRSEGLGELEALLAEVEAEGLDWLPLRAAIEDRMVHELRRRGEFQAASELGEQTFLDAIAGGDDVLAAAVVHKIAQAKVEMNETDAALRWNRVGMALLTRISPPGTEDPQVTRLRAGLLQVRGIIHRQRRAFDAALADDLEALALREESLGDRSPEVYGLLSNIGIIYRHLGDDAQALAYYERARAAIVESVGEDHVDLAPVLTNIAVLQRRSGESEAALANYRRALEIYEARSPNSPRIADVLAHIAWMLDQRGESREALGLRERILGIRERTLGEGAVDVGETCVNLGETHSKLGEHAQALAYFERARGIFADKLEPGDPRLGITARDHGEALLEAGERERGIAELERGIGLLAEGEGRSSTQALAEARLSLARALIDEAPERARVLAGEAAEGFEAAGDDEQAAAARAVVEARD
nr:protein kinase [Pseudenhygromyxa sp. WMMC2535]